MVWHGANGHHFSMAQWLEFGFYGQLWYSPGPYYPSSRIRSAKETVVYSKSLRTNQGHCGECCKLWDLRTQGAIQTMSRIVESSPDKIRWQTKETAHCWWQIRGLAEFLWHVISTRQQQLAYTRIHVARKSNPWRFPSEWLWGNGQTATMIKKRIAKNYMY